MFRLGDDKVYRSLLLAELPWIRHGFGTRQSPDWLTDEKVTAVRQIHSDKVVIANGESGFLGEGDALITRRPGSLVSVRTADCLPILIADVRKRTVAAVHAGWRGIISEIVAKTVGALERQFGSSPGDLRAAVGPAIGPCCFEVGPEVGIQFGTLFPERDNLHVRGTLDLLEAAYRQLLVAGIPPRNVDLARICTCCGGDLFESFRRDREDAGRMGSAIGIQA